MLPYSDRSSPRLTVTMCVAMCLLHARKCPLSSALVPRETRAVYNLWYSFVSTFIEEAGMAGNKAPPAPTHTSTAKTPKPSPVSTVDGTVTNTRGRNYAAVAAAALAASRGTKAGGRQGSKLSQANCKLQATATDQILPADTADHASSTTTPITATTTNAARAIIANSSTSPATGAQQSSRQQRLLRENRRPRGSVRHLPVFEGLGKGISAPLTISPPPMAELAGEKNELIPFGFGSACSSIPGFAVMVEDCCRAVGI